MEDRDKDLCGAVTATPLVVDQAMRFNGACHCGDVKATITTLKPPSALGVRTCQCSFCRRHGAVNVSDPDGLTEIACDERRVERYRFALETADFVICRRCGVYVAAVVGSGDNVRSTLNVAGLAIAAFTGVEERPIDYDAETTDVRTARRSTRWTPTRFTDAKLRASYFGPH
ncbi:MAG: aldehyde-activating protein [Parvularculaceae bacterium]